MSAEIEDGKVKGCFLVVIVIVAGIFSLVLGLYVYSCCARRSLKQSQPHAAEKGQDETVADDDDDATEIEDA
jgi:heme/copper-type cytochrome/quinol oxidase subunit 2